jgi:hypothetical protein
MKLRILIAIASVLCIFVFGCDKGGEEDEVKTMAEYEAAAKEEITEENMDAELSRLEKAIEQEVSESP